MNISYRPIFIGSSAIPSSSVAALLPFFFLEYQRNMMHEKKLITDTMIPK